jgi:hypothetical protein
MNKCRSCGANVLWAKTDLGKSMPVDPEPVPDGNVELYRTPKGLQVVVHGKEFTPDPRATVHKSHFATCPNAQRHRRAG